MNKLKQDLLSRDAHRIWSASWHIIHETKAESLLHTTNSLSDIERSVAGVSLGGGLASNSLALEFALKKLRFIKDSEGCICELNKDFERILPAKIAEGGDFSITKEDVNMKEFYGSIYSCVCNICGRRYRVEEDHSYHYPVAKWTEET